MPARICIPTPLRQYVSRKDAVDVSGGTVGEALRELTSKFPELEKHLYNDQGRLRSFINIYVNDEDIRFMQQDKTPLSESDEVRIVPAIAGGVPTAERATLSADEMKRYSRHVIMPEVGIEGQAKLKSGKVLAIGAGGLGSPLTMYLAAAGVGRIGIVDFDVVDVSNLQRQVLHSTASIGKPKLFSARERLSALNPEIDIRTYETKLTSENALDLMVDYDIVVDGTDNFPTRYLVNDACVLLGKPNVYGSIFRFEGQASVFAIRGGPCYRCLYPEPPPAGVVPSCAEGGVLGILPGIIGVIQATEAIKLLLGIGSTLNGRLLLFDALEMSFRELKLRRDPACPICGDKPTVHKLIDYEQFCGIAPAQVDSYTSEGDLDPVELNQWIGERRPMYLLDVREPQEYQLCRIPGAHLIPLGQLPSRLSEIDHNDLVVAYCRSGVRSGKATQLLKKSGFKKVKNLAGGILAWSDKVDPSVPKY